MADVPNEKEKLVVQLKRDFPKLLLVITKNNRAGKYGELELIQRMLASKGNLMLEFTNARESSLIAVTIRDPLGNIFCRQETNIARAATALLERLRELAGFTRVKSLSIGDAVPVPNEERFFEIVRGLGETFHGIIHGAHPERFLGNASFRCERGFPSFRSDELVFVSRRNIDKRYIGPEGFVGVKGDDITTVKYYGEAPPSVDTPVQLRIYQYYQNVRYLVHAHVGIPLAPVTYSLIPCGAIEEFGEILTLYPAPETTNVCINLMGHGCLVMANDLDYLEQVAYKQVVH
jgi:hypothetical protein